LKSLQKGLSIIHDWWLKQLKNYDVHLCNEQEFFTLILTGYSKVLWSQTSDGCGPVIPRTDKRRVWRTSFPKHPGPPFGNRDGQKAGIKKEVKSVLNSRDNLHFSQLLAATSLFPDVVK
jgi:hypothetical protein